LTGAAPVQPTGTDGTPTEGFDPSAHTVAEVVAYAQANPDEVPRLLAEEQAGKNRVTLLDQLAAIVA
jgi:hypothetical protein